MSGIETVDWTVVLLLNLASRPRDDVAAVAQRTQFAGGDVLASCLIDIVTWRSIDVNDINAVVELFVGMFIVDDNRCSAPRES